MFLMLFSDCISPLLPCPHPPFQSVFLFSSKGFHFIFLSLSLSSNCFDFIFLSLSLCLSLSYSFNALPLCVWVKREFLPFLPFFLLFLWFSQLFNVEPHKAGMMKEKKESSSMEVFLFNTLYVK